MKNMPVFAACIFLCTMIFIHAKPCTGETFYVRPKSDCPVNGNGTAYASASQQGQTGAWNSFSNVQWGSADGQVGPGDTLYVCGTHNEQLIIGTNGSPGSPVVIQGDYQNDPGIVRCPATPLDASWIRFPNTNIYYRTISDADWVGQLFLKTIDHKSAMTCDRARIRVGVPEYSDFRAYLTNPKGQADFVGYSEHHGNGTIEADRNTWLAATNEYAKWQVSCKLTKRRGADTYFRKAARLASDTVYILSYGGKSGGDGTGRISISCKIGETRYYLQNTRRDGIYERWTTSFAIIESKKDGIACVTKSDTSWTRKKMFFRSHPAYAGDYYLYFAPEVDDVDGNEHINIDDVTVYTVSHLAPNSFTTLSEIHGDANARSMDVTIYVHMPDGRPPGKNDVLYQNKRHAINLDNKNHVNICNLETWGSIAGDVTAAGEYSVAVDHCTVYYGGGAMQGPNGRMGKQSSRYTGAIAFLADKDHAYRKVTIKDCVINKSLGIGIRLRRCRSGWVAGNTINHFVCGNTPWPGAFYGTRVNNCVVEKNVCDTSGYDGSNMSGQWRINGIWFDNNSHNDTVRYNWVKNISGAYYHCESSDQGKWYYNIGSGGANYGFKAGGGQEAHDNEIYNNTLVDISNLTDETGNTYVGSGILLYSQEQGNTIVKNNVFQCSTGYYVYVHPNFKGKGATIDYNNYTGLSGNRWHWKGKDYSVFADWQKVSPNNHDVHGPQENNPLFANPTKGDFNLLPVSPCIDAGAYVGLNRDFAGTTVPHGNAVDVGSHEFVPTQNEKPSSGRSETPTP